MTLYLDTSHLVKLYVDEEDSDAVARAVASADAVVTSVLAYPEARATFARREGEKLMTPAEHRAAVRQLNDDWPHFVVTTLDVELSRAAGDLADRHRLRGGDAAHLATFEALLARAGDGDIRFASADERLSKAARALG